jgi:hypothetical protein
MVVVLSLILSTPDAAAQTPSGGPPRDPAGQSQLPVWSFGISAATYILPDEENYVQPTVTADRDALHIEARYNYEDRHSVSGFIGWAFEKGTKLQLELTPMIGGVVGDTDGIVPALELTLSFRRLEFYSEGEYVIGVNGTSSFLYNWSELSFRAADWMRAGMVTQRTRAFGTPRDIQRGVLAGVNVGRIEGTFYLFNPGADDYYVVATVGVAF